MDLEFDVSDDSGFLAIVDPHAYAGFVSKDWEYEQLIEHFQGQMQRQAMIFWATGLEGYWHVRVSTTRTEALGFREFICPIRVTSGSLLVTNYESLTMAAAYRDTKLPQSYETDQIVTLNNGAYECRVLQMFDPSHDIYDDCDDEHDDEKPDFVIEITPASQETTSCNEIPWLPKDE